MLFVSLVFSACAQTVVEEDSKKATINKIINGSAEGQEQATVALGDGSSFFCTGTLIRKNVVLSAGHCVATYDDETGEEEEQKDIYVYVVENGRVKEEAKVIDRIMHPGWNGNNLRDGVDLSLLYLDRNLSPSPIPIDSVPPEQRINEIGKAVGYGLTDGFNQASNQSQEKVSVRLKIESTEAGGRLISLVSPDETFRGTCNGDSGGPFFIQTALGKVLTGVTSFGDRKCIQSSLDVSVYYHSAWINQNLSNPVNGNRKLPLTACNRLYNCMYGCNGIECENQCRQRAFPIAISEFDAYVSCAQNAQCSPYDLQCASASCQSQINACGTPDDDLADQLAQSSNNLNQENAWSNNPAASSSASGEVLNCAALYGCTSNCSDDRCLNECASQSSEFEINLYNQMLYCFNDYQCQDYECVSQNCENVVINCFGYQPFTSDAQAMQNANPSAYQETNQEANQEANQNQNYGNENALTCVQLDACVTECNYDQNCIWHCGDQANLEALNQLNALYACINSSNCSTNECVENICAYEIEQCF
jgi:hypothetical protein